MLDAMFGGELSLSLVLGYFVLRFALTMTSYGSGAAGGIFAPLLVLGAQLGLVIGDLSRRVVPTLHVAPVTFAVVGMAAYFAAIVRAPLTGIVLIAEMTGGYELMLALLVACLSAYATADLLGDLPIYERLLARELQRGEACPELQGPLLLDLVIQPGTDLDGREVRDLALPDGCVLVTVRRGRGEHVPTADMALAAGDCMVLLVAPSAAGVVDALRERAERPAAR
jgi:CIC family chloride channel protein